MPRRGRQVAHHGPCQKNVRRPLPPPGRFRPGPECWATARPLCRPQSFSRLPPHCSPEPLSCVRGAPARALDSPLPAGLPTIGVSTRRADLNQPADPAGIHRPSQAPNSPSCLIDTIARALALPLPDPSVCALLVSHARAPPTSPCPACASPLPGPQPKAPQAIETQNMIIARRNRSRCLKANRTTRQSRQEG